MSRPPGRKIVRFPPLPALRAAPRSRPDRRQEQFQRIVANFAEALGNPRQVTVANTVHGLPASAVDLGRLKTVLEIGVAELDMAQVRRRWNEDVFEWIRLTIRSWVQRCKLMRIQPRGEGIHIKLQTQDDYGYYDYEFDVFPGRKLRQRRSAGRA